MRRTPPPTATLSLAVATMPLRVRLGLLYGGLTAAVVLLIAAITLFTHASGHTAATVHALAISSAVGVVVALGAGWLVAGRALRPVAALTETARAIAASRDLSRRVPVTGDRDELGQLAGTVNEMLASLERAYAAEQRFVSDASHELRAPLTAIQANLELLQRQPDMPRPDQQEAVAEAE